ncbi:hypothetical protein J1N35_017454 [Gossypium stocksii]|uniref:RNase H type-1 domain-containing protein n=1 Tax=Gossypium stocksii TaxID=47602 RepID=A0A9D3VN82_9ROSI|nr:hypothetical protein J1N35_017454 [Gossypium stocksii]
MEACNRGNAVRPTSRVEMVERVRWIRVRSDGAVKTNICYTAVGGVLRNHSGDWILGYNRKLRKCSIFEEELWGILDRVILTQGRQRDRVLVQTYNIGVIGSIRSLY